jgi:TRAP-type transport system periplasmic protein
MQKRLVPALVVAAAAVFVGNSASAADLVYGAGIPAKSEEITLGVVPYVEAINKAAKDINMKVLAGGQVVSLYNTLAALRDGTIDAGFVVPTFTRKELKHINVIYDTEVFGEDPAAVTGAANETILLHCPSCMKDFRDNNALYLGSFGNNQKGLICRNPVTKLSDVKGLKIRAVGATTRLMTAMGGVPVVMGPPDAATALSRGTIDCVHGVLTWLKNFGYWDVVHNMLEASFGSPRTISHAVWGRRTWNKLSLADKKIIINAVPASLAAMVYDVNVDADKRLKEIAIKDHHVKFTEAGKDFHDFMVKFRKKEMTEIPALDKKNLGVANADEIFNTFIKMLDKWDKIAKDTNMKEDKAKMTEIYKKEIYDKLDPAKL